MRFGDFEFDSLSGQLFREGRSVKIQPQPLRVLSVLLEKPGETVSREQLRTRVWGEATYVEFDQGLNYCIRQIRVALRDGATEPLYIETLPKQGYRFIARVTVAPGVPEADGAKQAGEHARVLLDNAGKYGVPKYVATARRLLGEIAALKGDHNTAEDELTRSLEPFAAHPMPLIEWRHHAALARLLAFAAARRLLARHSAAPRRWSKV